MTTAENNARPDIDIIVPVYNTARYLDRCIESVAAQDISSWHLILVDDGSTDDSPEICDRWAAHDRRITVIHKPNTGQADSRNVAMDACTAEYVGFVDSDDWIEPHMYSTLIASMKQHNADIAVCNHFCDTRRGSLCRHHDGGVQLLDADDAHRLVIQDRIQSYIWQMVFRRKCLAARMPGHICFEDYAVLPQWFASAERIVRTMQPLYHYRLRRSSVVHSVSPQQEYAFMQAERQRYEFYRDTPHAQLSALWLLKRGVRVAKHIARMKGSRADIIPWLDSVKGLMPPCSAQLSAQLKRKERMLLAMLTKHPNLFVAYQKTETLVMAHKKASDRYYFE